MRRPASQIVIALLAVTLLLGQAGEPKRLGIVTQQTGFTVAVADRNGAEYVGLVEALEPMGQVTATPDGRKWTVRFGTAEAEFREGETRCKVRNQRFDLTSKLLVENARPMVPVASLPRIVEAFTGVKPEWNPTTRRLFVGATAVRAKAELQRGTPSALVLHFSAPVNPQVGTEPGRVRLTFTREALTGGDFPPVTDPLIAGVSFGETNGAAEIAVSGSAPLMARFSDSNKTITVTAAPGSATVKPPSPAPTVAPMPVPTAPQPRRIPAFVLIDAAHGGDDGGAKLTDKLAEKDFVLTVARRLQADLESRGIASRLLRDRDLQFATEERARAINAASPALVVFIHATPTGTGVHVVTSPLAPLNPRPAALPWDTSQAAFVSQARAVAGAASSEFLKRDIPATPLAVSVPPLNRVAAPAVIFEVAPPAGRGAAEMHNTLYIQSVSSAIATAVAGQRAQWTPREGAR